MGKIYIITNKINDKIYVGKTERTIEERWKQHQYAMSSPNKKHYKLYAAMNKYGLENFSICLLEECSNQLLNERETYWIKRMDSYNNGYNMTLGGDGTYSIAEEEIFSLWDEGLAIKEIAEQLGYSTATVTRRLQQYANYSHEEAILRGTKFSASAKQKQCYVYDYRGDMVKQYSTLLEASEKLNLNIKQLRNWCRQNAIREGCLYSYDLLTTDEVIHFFLHQKHCKAVEQIDLEGNHIKTYISVKEAMRLTGANNISQVASGKMKTSGGFIWKYVDDITQDEQLPASIQNKKQVAQYSTDGKLIQVYNSILEAAKATGQKSSSNITQVCKGKAKTAGGFIWKYYEKSNE